MLEDGDVRGQPRLAPNSEIKLSASRMFIPPVLPNHAANSFISEFRVAEEQLFRHFMHVCNFVSTRFPVINKIKAYGYINALILR